MRTIDAVLWVALVIASSGLFPIGYVVVREAKRRKSKARALRRLREAEQLVQGVDADSLAAAAEALRAFDQATLERTVEALLDEPGGARRATAVALARRLDLEKCYADRARTAPAWSERLHAVRMLGRLAIPESVATVAAVLRDRYEEAAVRAEAAEALAQLHDPAAVPPLLAELSAGDESASSAIAEALVRFGHAAAPALIRVLDDPAHPPARVWAARILGRIGETAAVEPLIARLRDRNEGLRTAAAEALGSLGDRRAIAPLTQTMLRDPLPQVRAPAASALATIAGEQVAGVLVSALSDPDYATRIRAIEAFENMHLSDISALERALGDANAEVRRRAAVALERTGHLEHLIAQLGSDDRARVQVAYAGVLQLGAAGLVEGIAAWLRHESMQVRALIARACGELGIARIGPMLVAGLDDPAWPVRASLCDAIRRLRPAGGASALVRLLSDPEESVREAAAEAMTSFASSELLPFETEIATAYQNGSVPVRLAMVELSARLDLAPMTQLVVDATRDPSESVRLCAVRSLAAGPPPSAVPALVLALQDASFDVRLAAVPALGAAGTAEACEALLRALPGAQPELRESVAQALAGIGRSHLFTNVDELSRSDDPDVRLGIAWTLGKIGDPIGRETLSRFLHDKDPRLRASAAGALGKIAGAETVRILLGAAGDRDPKTRAAVVNAMAKMGAAEPSVVNVLEQRLFDPDSFVRNRAGIALARVAPERAQACCMSAQTARLLDEAALTVMLALVGTEETIGVALTRLADANARAKVQAFLDREDVGLRTEFFAGLRLSDRPQANNDYPLDPVALAAQYERLLRTSQTASERRSAVDALARLPTTPNLAAFAEALASDPADGVRIRCAQVLGARVEDAVARAALLRAVSDPNDEVALTVIRSLQRRPEHEVASALYARLMAGSEAVNLAVEETLASLYREDPMPLFDRVMGADNAESLISALRVLERLATPTALPLLSQILKSSDAAVRTAAVRAIAKIANPEASMLAGRMLDDPHETVRIAALEAMVTEGAASVVRLASARVDPSVRVRQRLSELLVQCPGTAGTRVLDGLLQDASPIVRGSAMATQLAMADPESLRRFAHSWRTATAEARLELRKDGRAESITQRLALSLAANADTAVREAAVTGIGALAIAGYEQHLLVALADPKAIVRVAAARALAPSRSPEIRKRVSVLLDDPDSSVRDAVRDAVLHSAG